MIDVSEPPAPHVRSFDEVYRAERDGLVRLAALVLGSTAAADDVVHDAFADLHRRWSDVDNPPGWLRTTVVRRCLNERRRWRNFARMAPRWARPDETDPMPPEPLLDVLATLPVRQRTAVVLRYYADLSEAEIAAAMGIAAGTVKSTLHRALARLRQEVEP